MVTDEQKADLRRQFDAIVPPRKPMNAVLVPLYEEIVRQCGIGAGTISIDDVGLEATGLWTIEADLDPVGLAQALSRPSAEIRPPLCRNRLRDEGKAYPKSGCKVCHKGGIFGCPFENRGASNES